MKKTARYYSENPHAAAVKARYQRKFNAKPEQVKRRVELNKYNREHGKVGDKLDASHKGGKIVGFEAQSRNRGRREKSRLRGSKRH